MKDNDLINNALCNRVLKEKAAYAVALFALFVFLHGADMFHFSLCGDELKETMEDIPDIYIAQRRWGIALWKMIFGFGYLPFLNVPIFAAVSVVTIMLQVEILRIRTQTGKCIYGLAFAVCPVWLSLVRISHLSDIFALSMLCSTLTVWSVVRVKGGWGVFSGMVSMMFAMALYQTSVFYVATLWMAWFVFRCRENATIRFWRNSLKAAVVLLAGWGAAFAVSCILRRMGIAALEVIHMVDNYQLAFSGGIKELLRGGSHDELAVLIGGLFKDAALYAIGAKALVGGNKVFTQAYYMCGALACVCVLLLSARRSRGGKLCVGIILLLMLPYVTYLMSLGSMVEYRMYMSSAVSAAAMWALLAEEFETRRYVLRLLMILLGLFVLKAGYINTIAARNSAWYMERTRQMFCEMQSSAQRVAAAHGMKGYKVIWVGDAWSGKSASPYAVERALEMTDPCFLDKQVQPFAVKHFAAYYGCGDMEWLWSIPDDLNGRLDTMPTWPHPDSVQPYHRDIIIHVYRE